MVQVDSAEEAHQLLLHQLQEAYGHPIHEVTPGERTKLLPKGRYVYLLSCDGTLVVAGQGDKLRAQVVMDACDGQATIGHVKSMFVRLLKKYRPNAQFVGLWIGPLPADEAKQLEKDIHKRFGGNALALPSDVRTALERDLAGLSESTALLVKLATLSFYSGLSDLRRWAQAELVSREDALAIDGLLGGAICITAPKASRNAPTRTPGAAN